MQEGDVRKGYSLDQKKQTLTLSGHVHQHTHGTHPSQALWQMPSWLSQTRVGRRRRDRTGDCSRAGGGA